MDRLEKRVSVIIPTYNRIRHLKNTIHFVLKQNYSNFEIIIVSQRYPIEIETNHQIKHFHLKEANLPRARNEGISHATGEIILFLDDDIEPIPDLIRNHVAAHLQDIALVTGRVVDSRFVRKSELPVEFNCEDGEYVTNFSNQRPCYTISVAGGNLSVKREILKDVYFDSFFVGNALFEEVDFAFRINSLGHKIFFQPSAELRHLIAEEGGCRQDKGWKYFYFQFRNTALFFFKHCSLYNLFHFIQRQKNLLEYLSRIPGRGHDLYLVMGAMLGMVMGGATYFVELLFFRDRLPKNKVKTSTHAHPEMKVAFISPGMEKDGISDYAFFQYNHLKDLTDVQLFSYQGICSDGEVLKLNRQYSLCHIHYNEEQDKTFRRFIKQIKIPKILTLHEIYRVNPFYFPRPSPKSRYDLITLLKRLKYDLTHFSFNQKLRWLKKKYGCDHLIVHEVQHKSVLIDRGIPAGDIAILPHAVPLINQKINKSELKRKMNIQGQTVGLTFGFISEANDYLTVLKAIRRLGHEQFVYIIAGEARLPRHQQIKQDIISQIESMGLQQRVILTGYLTNDQIHRYFSVADFYLAPFKFRSVSGSMAYAFAYHLPIFASKIEYTESLNHNHKALLLYENESGLESLLRQAIQNPEILSDVRENVVRYAEQNSIQEINAQLIRFYKEVLKRES